jgi:integral membrane protein
MSRVPLPSEPRVLNGPGMKKTSIAQLRQIGWIEGVSYLLLLGVAMPLKYFAGMPMAVKVVGWAHGVLFVLFCFALLKAMLDARWSLYRGAIVFIAALLPFGPYLVDRRLVEWEAEYLRRQVPGA